jgi:hypothetical protein
VRMFDDGARLYGDFVPRPGIHGINEWFLGESGDISSLWLFEENCSLFLGRFVGHGVRPGRKYVNEGFGRPAR